MIFTYGYPSNDRYDLSKYHALNGALPLALLGRLLLVVHEIVHELLLAELDDGPSQLHVVDVVVDVPLLPLVIEFLVEIVKCRLVELRVGLIQGRVAIESRQGVVVTHLMLIFYVRKIISSSNN